MKSGVNLAAYLPLMRIPDAVEQVFRFLTKDRGVIRMTRNLFNGERSELRRKMG